MTCDLGDNSLTYTREFYDYNTLPKRVLEKWRFFIKDNPSLYSPYFHPDYTALVSELRDDVSIAVLECDNSVVAILPFQGAHFARPVGAPMTDYQGVICSPDKPYSIHDVLGESQIGVFGYDALVSGKKTKSNSAQSAAVIAFPNGYEDWLSSRDSAFTKHQKETRRRLRKASADIGEPKLITQSRDIDIFNQLVSWKSKQFAHNKIYNVLGVDWTVNLLKNLLRKSEQRDIWLDMHALYFGDRLAAIDTGLTDGKTYHRWIVAYDPELHKYAPGTQMLNFIIRSSDELGYSRIDHGVGREDFKKYYATEDVDTYTGYTALGGYGGLMANMYNAVERGGRKHLSDLPGKMRRRYYQVSNCETGFFKTQTTMIRSICEKVSA